MTRTEKLERVVAVVRTLNAANTDGSGDPDLVAALADLDEPPTREEVAVRELRRYADDIEAGKLRVYEIAKDVGYDPPLYEGGQHRATSWKVTVHGPLDRDAGPTR